MADHLWFIPATGGRGLGAYPGGMPKAIAEFNVQWDFHPFPVGEPAVEFPFIEAMTFTAVTPGSQVGPTPAKLVECFAAWRWRSCALGGVIVTGGELMVGTVFANWLPLLNNYDPNTLTADWWNSVEVWAKYRVSDVTKLSTIMLSINDNLGNVHPVTVQNIGLTVSGQWRVVHGLWLGPWPFTSARTNLRGVLTFQGTLLPANVGVVEVDVEWFAFRLRDQGG